MSLTYIPFANIPGKLFRSPMPFARFDFDNSVFKQYLEAEISTVVMLIEEGEDQNHAGQDLNALYTANGIKTIHFPIVDFETPEDSSELEKNIELVLERINQGENIAVHCFAGRGRTGMFLALLARRILFIDGEEAIKFLRTYFPAVETSEQEQLVINYKLPD